MGGVTTHGSDCDCITHDGPHWLHMDQLHREMNRDILERAMDDSQRGFVASFNRIGLFHAFAEEELARLAEKKRHLLEEERDERAAA